MLQPWEMEGLRGRLKEVICPVCIERRPDGRCGLTLLERCPIDTHLHRLVAITESVKSDRMEDYVQKVRQDVCSICRNRLFRRTGCNVRREGHCALDAYLLIIVQTIDEYLSKRAGQLLAAGK